MSDLTNIGAGDIERLENDHDSLLFKLAGIGAANQETVPGSVVDRLMAGESPLAVWRQHRKLSQQALAEAAGVHAADIESVERDGAELGLRGTVAIARALRIDAEDLLPWLDPEPSP